MSEGAVIPRCTRESTGYRIYPAGERPDVEVRAVWSRNDPVSVLGALMNAHGQQELDDLFATLGGRFSDCTSYEFELLSYDVVGDMAYTEGFEHTSVSVEGEPRSYTLRATQVYRRENGHWRVAHRHADSVIG